METNNAERPTLKILARLAKKRMKYNELVKVDSITAFDKELEALKDKVRTLIANDKDTTAPIMKLVDQEKMKNFNSVQRDKYILDIIEVYSTLRAELSKPQIEICQELA